MFKGKRFLSAALAGLLLCSLTACNGNEGTSDTSGSNRPVESAQESDLVGNTYKKGFPIVKDPITLKVMTLQFPWQADFNEIEVYKEYEKMTNVHIEWELMPSTDLQTVGEKLNLAFQSGQLPDVFMMGDNVLTDQQVLTYGPQGMLKPVSDYSDFTPNLNKLLEENPSVRKSLTAEDGKIYSMPALDLNESGHGFFSFKLYINKEWLDTLSLDIPSTTEEMFNVLRQFRDNDPNNNQKKDEIPLCLSEFSPTFAMAPFGGPTYYYPNDYMTLDKDEKVTFGPTTEAFKKGMEMMNQLYKEGLLDKDFGKISSAGFQGKIRAGRVGMFMSFADFLDASVEDDDKYIMIEPINAPGYEKTWYYDSSASIKPHAWTITSACQNPEAAARWADYFYTVEGRQFSQNGPEGITWKWTEDGKIMSLGETNKPAEITDNQMWMGTIAMGHLVPGANLKEFEDLKAENPDLEKTLTEIANDNLNDDVVRCYESYKPQYTLPYLMKTQSEIDALNTYKDNVMAYYSEMLFKFIYGDANVNAEWDAYVAELNKRGVPEMIKVYQEAYNRYKAA